MRWPQISPRVLPCRVVTFPVVGLLVCGTGAAFAQNAGWPGPSYVGTTNAFPTGSKPESKLWWNHGLWWGCLWSTGAQAFTIHAFDAGRRLWIDTGTAVDVRPKSRADCLWDGARLYIGTHEYTDGLGGPGHPLELYRYSYDPRQLRYSLDVGFPTLIADARSETLVIEKDSNGTLWAVWTAGYRVWIANTVGDDRSWSPASVHPSCTSDMDVDDIASVVSFQDRIGVLWSDQVLDAFHFAFHVDGTPASSWSPRETVLAGLDLVEDSISLKGARDGRVFAAVETETGETRLEVRAAGGGWSDHLVAAQDANWNHPIVVLDEEERTVHVFAAKSGAIHEKTAALDAPAFPSGDGLPVIRHAGHPFIVEASSTKRSVDGATGLVVIASHTEVQRYAHHHATLGGPPLSAPVAVFHANQREGYEPVTVQFLDASTGSPTRRLWTFGDGTTSVQRNPRHVYQLAGTYTVSLEVENALGLDVATRTDLVRVESLPASLALRAIADGSAYEGQPDTNMGGLGLLRVRGGRDPDYRSFMKFFVPPSQGLIASATVRLFCVDNSDGDNGLLYLVDDSWSEPTLTWNTMPLLGSAVGDLQAAVTGQSIDVDVSAVASGSGTVSFGISNTSYHSAYYSSREGVSPPELQVAFAQGFSASPEPRFEASRLRGSAPLTVQFFDTSNGRVDAWLWDFGDGATSDLQNPAHIFCRPGLYEVRLSVTSPSGTSTCAGPDLVDVRPRDPYRDPYSHADEEPAQRRER